MNKKVMAIVAVIALVAILGICLVACNAESYQKKLEKEGYKVETYDADSDYVKAINKGMAEDEDYSGEIKWAVVATKVDLSLSKGLDAGHVSIYKFAKIADAKQFVKDMGAEEDSENVVRKGNIVFVGDKASVDIVA
mgnify:CR=1 FL=1